MLAEDETPKEVSVLAAQHVIEDARRSLSERLLHLRIRRERIFERPLRLCRLGDPIPAEANAHALHIVLRGDTRVWSHDMRPTSLWLIASYEGPLLVLASGSDAWEYARMDQAQALERMKEVLGTV